ncbi:TadE/TadG family type IV pilus assembly protein [Salipaludibacillus daqingensis]|uniref:TadE/TadG family type IV pilus assembly protein n=1 Tax=Salipaludibacillus daqingensis TaxID=3041001 RepID=UPI00247493D9|nr:pilus assembly protein [Salipaludibacillus daqingensis]
MKRNWIRKEDGSLTLEAALVMPVFLLFTVFLATMIRISIADMALKQAVSESTEIIATHAYPVVLAGQSAQSYADRWIRNHTEEELDLDQASSFADHILQEFGVDAGAILTNAVEGEVEKIMKAKFSETTGGDGLFSNDTLEVEITEFPSLASDSYIGVAATYEIPIQVPFVNQTITLEQRAYERLWTGS